MAGLADSNSINGQHAAHRAGGEELVGHAAENPLTQTAVAVATGHDQVGVAGPDKVQELGGGRSPGSPPDLVGDDDR